MEYLTVKIIKGLKQMDASTIYVITRIMSAHSWTPSEYITVHDITKTLLEAVQDYMDTCDNPSAEFRRLMAEKYDNLAFYYDDISWYARFLRNIKVREKNAENDDYHYINGFDGRYENIDPFYSKYV